MDESTLDTLFMELAGETRRLMLKQLVAEETKLSKLAEKLELTIQDAHRNSSRLEKSGLIEKKTNGSFFLTPLGKILINHLDSFEFLSKNQEFFKLHSTGDLPPKYIRRMGDLSNSNFVTGMGPVLESLKRLANESKKFIKVISSQYPLDTARVFVEKANKNIPISYIFDHYTTVPEKERNELLKSSSWKRHILEGTVQRKMKNKLQVCVTVTDRGGGLFFPDLKGNNSMLSGFFSTDPLFLDWCEDYFDDVWKLADEFDETKLVKI
jgi:predicted transcriptional regulator